jgi:hypothetical protein
MWPGWPPSWQAKSVVAGGHYELAGIRILEHALLNCRRILATPTPSITVNSITATCVEFDVAFFVEELAQATRAQNELFDLIFRHLAVAGIHLASVQHASYSVSPTATGAEAASGPERVLDLVAIFAALTVDEQRLLATKMKSKTYDHGEVLFEPGTVLQSLFIVGAGVLSLTHNPKSGSCPHPRQGFGTALQLWLAVQAGSRRAGGIS